MKKNIDWFSLIEVIVATSILTIAVFWIFKLISENSKILANSQNYIQANLLLQPTKECLDYLFKSQWLDYLKNLTTPIYIDLLDNNSLCLVWNSSTRNILDDIEYVIYLEKYDEWINFINWKINIKNDSINTISIEYLQK